MARHPEWPVAAGVNAGGDAESRARWLAGLAALLALWLASCRLAAALPVAQWVEALSSPLAQLELPEVLWRFALLPQLTMALLVGAALGVAGVLLQQGLRNPLAAPETLGIQSGGLLAMALVVLYRPTWLAVAGEWVAFGGGLAAAALVLALAARRQGSPLVLLLVEPPPMSTFW